MGQSESLKTQTLIAAATTTSELSEVRKIAREMSLGVMNAKAISCRAGEVARGFQPITDFIDEMAHEVMQLVGKISNEALHLSRLSVEHNHVQATLSRFQQVASRAEDAKFIASLTPSIQNLTTQANDCQQQFLANIRTLRVLLEDVSCSTRGAQVISATSRVEASQAGAFSKSLEHVAENLEQATEKIRQLIKNSDNRLKEVMLTLSHKD